MTLLSFFDLKTTLISALGALILHRLYWETTTGAPRRAPAKKHGCLPPKRLPSRPFLFGLDLFLANINAFRTHKLLETWCAVLRDNDAHTILMELFGQPVYLTDDPENVKAMLSTDFETWSLGQDRIQQMSSYLGHGIFTNEGAAWKHSREMLRPCFERSQVADVSLLKKHTQRLIAGMAKDGETVDLQPWFHELTLDVATEFLFGRSTDSLVRNGEENASREFVEAFEYCQNPFGKERSEKYGILGSFVLPDWKFKRCAKVIHDFTDAIITSHLASSSNDNKEAASSDTKESPTTATKLTPRPNFLTSLLLTTRDLPTIRSELLNILLAGRDTTASLLSNLLWSLSQHPTMLSRLRSEIASVIGPSIPTYHQLKDLKYLRALINESQRMYPIVPSNSRQALRDAILPRGGGEDGLSPVLVPKGAYVVFHSWSMHRRADVYGEDADEFTPERWLDEDHHPASPLRPGWAYIPFSGGPRTCIGQNFALTECMFVVVRLVQGFEIEGRDEEPWREAMSVTCTGLGGCKVGLRPRE